MLLVDPKHPRTVRSAAAVVFVHVAVAVICYLQAQQLFPWVLCGIFGLWASATTLVFLAQCSFSRWNQEIYCEIIDAKCTEIMRLTNQPEHQPRKQPALYRMVVHDQG